MKCPHPKLGGQLSTEKSKRPQWRLMVEGPHQSSNQAYEYLSKPWFWRRADPHSIYGRCQTHPKGTRARLARMTFRILRMRRPNQTKGLHNPMTKHGRLPLPSSTLATAFTLSLRLAWAMLRLKARRKRSAASGRPKTSPPNNRSCTRNGQDATMPITSATLGGCLGIGAGGRKM